MRGDLLGRVLESHINNGRMERGIEESFDQAIQTLGR